MHHALQNIYPACALCIADLYRSKRILRTAKTRFNYTKSFVAVITEILRLSRMHWLVQFEPFYQNKLNSWLTFLDGLVGCDGWWYYILHSLRWTHRHRNAHQGYAWEENDDPYSNRRWNIEFPCEILMRIAARLRFNSLTKYICFFPILPCK